ncbi:MAG: hypothetical protein M3O35_13685 [Acidobacteriota bacterium]|nr:hypothetical protein [Acidobacteriota bacterium]
MIFYALTMWLPSALEAEGRAYVQRIAIIDHSGTGYFRPEYLSALQIQFDRDFTPAWRKSIQLYVLADMSSLAPDDFYLEIASDDRISYSGWHSVDVTGRPFAMVRAGYPDASELIGHELLELAANPWLEDAAYFHWEVVQADGNTFRSGFVFRREICDPVTGTTYYINGVSVPNFVFPSYFQQARGKAPFDKLGVITEPGGTLFGYNAEKPGIVVLPWGNW